MLTRELRDLEKNDIISRKIYAEIPPRVEYSLTKKGKTLLTLIYISLLFMEQKKMCQLSKNLNLFLGQEIGRAHV